MSRTRLNPAKRSVRTLLVLAMVATLVAAVPTSSFAAPGDSPRPTWPAAGVTATVSNVTATTATLTLSAPAVDAGGVTAYNVYGGAGNTDLLGTSTTTTINLTGLDAETAYTVHVEAVDGDGNVSEQLTGFNFSVPVTYSTGASSNPYSIQMADFDKDGDTDLAVANETDSEIGILIGAGDGTFGAVSGYATGTDIDGDGPKNFAVANVNAGTDVDLVVANEFSETVGIMLGNGDGSFGAPSNLPGPVGTHGLVVANFDADPALDIVAVGWGPDIPEVLVPPTPAVPNPGMFFSGNGNGTFDASTVVGEGPSSHQVELPTSTTPPVLIWRSPTWRTREFLREPARGLSEHQRFSLVPARRMTLRSATSMRTATRISLSHRKAQIR